jgi:hypothetical protein
MLPEYAVEIEKIGVQKRLPIQQMAVWGENENEWRSRHA